MRERSYFTQERREVMQMIPRIPGKHFLDLGCGEGGLGRLLMEQGAASVVGIEVEDQAATRAARYYHRVYTADLDLFEPSFAPEGFDGLICADVLEHLKDPWSMLERFRPVLRQDGFLVASIPNIGNVETLGQLLRGRFDYADWGVMDRTHLRFFTRGGIEKMFEGAGYAVNIIQPKVDPNTDAILDLWHSQEMARRIRDLAVLMGGKPFLPTTEDLRQMLTVQYLVVASRKA